MSYTQLTLDGEEQRDPLEDPELLRELYHGGGFSLGDIGDMLGCDRTTVYRRMREFGIERREPNTEREPDDYAKIHTRADGYETVWGDSKIVLVHRLVAVAEHGFEAVADSVIHHKNGLRWDNRPSNLEVLGSHREHVRREQEQERGSDDDLTLGEFRE